MWQNGPEGWWIVHKPQEVWWCRQALHGGDGVLPQLPRLKQAMWWQVHEAEGALGYLYSGSGHDSHLVLWMFFTYCIKPAIVPFPNGTSFLRVCGSFPDATCGLITEGEAKECSADHQLPSSEAWARQVPLVPVIPRPLFPSHFYCLWCPARSNFLPSSFAKWVVIFRQWWSLKPF